MKRNRGIAVAAAVVLVAAGGAVAANAGDGTARRRDPDVPPATAPVRRGDLSDSSAEQGTLGYGNDRELKAGAAGVVTWVRSPGSRAGRNDAVYEVDGRPVLLMYGARPMYRALKTGAEGPDVLQLERNLRALGYGRGLTVDRKYTAATAAAVGRWQKARGGAATGTVGPGAIVFAPGPVRVSRRNASAGDRVAPGGPVVTATGTERVVAVKLDVDRASVLRTGTRVTVELPDGRTVPGSVRRVGTTAVKDPGQESGGGAAKVTVVIGLAGTATGLDQAPVTVHITTRTRRNVLSVPVEALLALPGGGYGVRVVDGGRPRTVAVEPGVFGAGRVEVRGDGLAAGVRVEVPSP